MGRKPNREAGVILLSVPCSERVPPLIWRLTTRWRRLSSAVRLRRIVRWHIRMRDEDEELLDVALNASAQLGLGCRRVVAEGLADAQQQPFPIRLGGAPSRWLLLTGK